MSSRTHDRRSFFKYMAPSTAKAVLTHRTLRWSSPLLFNDPFDVPRELSFGITSAQIVEALAKRVAQIIQFPPSDTSQLELKLKLLVETIKKGVTPELMTELLSGLQNVSSWSQLTDENMDLLRSQWRSWLSEFRILCFTESPAHAAMWYHYADRYKGVVLEFKCNDHTDSPWLVARRVDYPEVKPMVYTAEGWAELLTLQLELAVKKLLDVSTYTKSQDWSYEKEWRVVSFKRQNDIGQYSDYSFANEDLVGVYLGPLIEVEDRSDLITYAAKYPTAKVFAVSLGMSREFSFDEVGD